MRYHSQREPMVYPKWMPKEFLILILTVLSLIVLAQAQSQITLDEITINVDGSYSAHTRVKGQSQIKDIVSSDGTIASARENGTNDVLITGRHAGVAVIRFRDAATGTSYRVTVNVKERERPNPAPPS